MYGAAASAVKRKLGPFCLGIRRFNRALPQCRWFADFMTLAARSAIMRYQGAGAPVAHQGNPQTGSADHENRGFGDVAAILGSENQVRIPGLDIARGAAIAQMVAFHLCYDLNFFGWIRVSVYDNPYWIAWRTLIVAQFLFLAGVSLTLGRASDSRSGYSSRFWRRWVQIALCAALVSAGSWAIFGQRFIWFGVLHFVALAQLLLVPLVALGTWNLLLGALALALGLGVQLPAFAGVSLSWIGFSPVKPRTEDFVPLLPWIGVVLAGMAACTLWRASRSRWAVVLRAESNSQDSRLRRIIAFAGRWPLTVYMVHQPALFGVLYGIAALQRAWR
jgi:uncharacterized membrane protein